MKRNQSRLVLAIPAGQAVEVLEGRTLLAATPSGNELPDAVNAPFDPTTILVQFNKNAPAVNGSDVMKGTKVGRSVGLRARLRTVSLEEGTDVQAALEAYRKNPHVALAEPNYLYTAQAVNDPYYTNGSLWGVYGDASTPSNVFGSQAAEAWAAGHTGSSDVYVGIIDEGVQVTHPDLVQNAWVNPYEIAGNGLDDDGNGYRDDVNGYDFANNDASVYDGTYDDHGTHVAGTIAAAANNGIGVAGVAPNVKFITAKFLLDTGTGGSTEAAIRALDYFVDLKQRHGLNIVATNNSWGGGAYSTMLLAAITRAAEAGILFVAAAGNGGPDQVGDNNDAAPFYPANYETTAAGYDAVISVAAIRSDGQRASFSNYGATHVDLGAPGQDIISTMPNGYGSKSGTSMATPHVTGAVVLYAATHAGTEGSAIREAILDGARATPTSSMATTTTTGGRLNIPGTLAHTSLPPAPSDLAATPSSSTQITLTWRDNSGNEDEFIIQRTTNPADATTWQTVGGVVRNVTSFTDSGLEPGTAYAYRVIASNELGQSSASNEASATTKDIVVAPNAPTALAVKSMGTNRIDLTWTDNSGDESGFVVERSTDAGFSVGATVALSPTLPGVTSLSDANLATATRYYYRVRSFRNDAGGVVWSEYSSAASTSTAAPIGNGAGLTGRYYDYNTSNTSVAPSTSLAFGSLKMTRTDASVNFNWGSGSPTNKISRDTYAVRWTGQVQPRYSDEYVFTAYADDGVRLWINGQLITDAWRVNWGDLVSKPITLSAGVKYNIQLDYFEGTQGALARLDWHTTSGSVARQTIPQSQLYPTTTAGTPVYAIASQTTGSRALDLGDGEVMASEAPGNLPASPFSRDSIREDAVFEDREEAVI